MPIRFIGGATRATILNAVVPAFQANVTLNQAAPVVNTWYTVLNTVTFARVLNIMCLIGATGEDLEIEVTVDGVVFDSVFLGVAANTVMFCHFIAPFAFPPLGMVIGATAVSMLSERPFFFDAKSLRVRIRKVTANGVGNLYCGIDYQLY